MVSYRMNRCTDTISTEERHQQVSGWDILQPFLRLIEITVCLLECQHCRRLKLIDLSFTFRVSTIPSLDVKNRLVHERYLILLNKIVLTWLNCITYINMNVIAVIFWPWRRLIDDNVGEKRLIAQNFGWKINSICSTWFSDFICRKIMGKLDIKYLS